MCVCVCECFYVDIGWMKCCFVDTCKHTDLSLSLFLSIIHTLTLNYRGLLCVQCCITSMSVSATMPADHTQRDVRQSGGVLRFKMRQHERETEGERGYITSKMVCKKTGELSSTHLATFDSHVPLFIGVPVSHIIVC